MTIKRVCMRGCGRTWAAVILSAALLVCESRSARAQVPNPQPTVHLFSVGDWGLDSPDRQTVANAMADRAAIEGAPQAVLLLGDNYYVKLASVDDPQIQTFFEQTYSPSALNVPFFAVLGNHDYKEKNDVIEMDYARRTTRFKLPARWYRLDLPPQRSTPNEPAALPLVTLLMLDSDHDYMPASMWNDELAWMKTELSKPHAPWLVCCAHHDMFGNGSHGDNGVLITQWGSLFKQFGVQFYVCGHEHTLQHLEVKDWPVSFVIAGGGGAKHKGMLQDRRGPFSSAIFGFADLHFTPQQATVQLIGEHDQILHAFNRDQADGHIAITFTTPSDKATTKPLSLISGGGD